MRIAALQINPLVGSPAANYQKIEALIRKNLTQAELFVTPELALVGYPPRDLLSFPNLLQTEALYLEKLKALSEELQVGILVGHTQKNPLNQGKPLNNCASLFDKGVQLGRIVKTRLPEYNIFEEERFFEPARLPQDSLTFRNVKIGISICEDSWDRTLAFGRQDVRPYAANTNPILLHTDAQIEINLSASPYSMGKIDARQDLIKALAMRHQKTFVYCTCVGAQDDIIFDGGSFGVNTEGQIFAAAKRFKEDVLLIDTAHTSGQEADDSVTPNVYLELTDALVLGLRDYVQKNNFKSVVLGISGGIDSALCAYLACKALGPENVYGVALPSALSASESLTLAQELANRLGFRFRTLPIADAVESLRHTLQIKNAGLPYENLQSRVRGTLLMGLSNNEGHLLLTTGNKSELAMGYGTLYGDMCGGLNPLGDLFKTDVFALVHSAAIEAAKRNKPAPIPYGITLRTPSAELAPNQKDSDSLPPYEILDMILEDFVENTGKMRFKKYGAILGDKHTLAKLSAKMHSQEFKRYQAPPILRVRHRAFGSGWRMPLSKGAVEITESAT